MVEVSDYQVWKSVWLVKPTRTNLYDIVLSLGGDSVSIEAAEENLKKYFLDNLTTEDFYRFCLFNILIKIRNQDSKLFRLKLKTVYNSLGYIEIKQILQ